jgi:hypothetical protein
MPQQGEWRQIDFTDPAWLQRVLLPVQNGTAFSAFKEVGFQQQYQTYVAAFDGKLPEHVATHVGRKVQVTLLAEKGVAHNHIAAYLGFAVHDVMEAMYVLVCPLSIGWRGMVHLIQCQPSD